MWEDSVLFEGRFVTLGIILLHSKMGVHFSLLLFSFLMFFLCHMGYVFYYKGDLWSRRPVGCVRDLDHFATFEDGG